jgi:acyl transferase domain-containing protein
MTTLDQNAQLDGVAIIGIAGRFPGARNVAEFWRVLQAGLETITRFEPGTLEPSGLEDPASVTDPNYVPARGILTAWIL